MVPAQGPSQDLELNSKNSHNSRFQGFDFRSFRILDDPSPGGSRPRTLNNNNKTDLFKACRILDGPGPGQDPDL